MNGEAARAAHPVTLTESQQTTIQEVSSMCQRVNCPKCGRPTFRGCGMHVEQVLGGVPKDERCRCHEEARKDSGGERRSWLRNLMGK